MMLFIRALRRMLGWPGAASRLRTYKILPALADPNVTAFNDRNLIVFDKKAGVAPLAVFLPGTGGKPKNARELMRVVARCGYRAVALKYNDTPAVDQVCHNDPDLTCSERFRRMRVDGEGGSRQVRNPPAESIVSRLSSLLTMLATLHPEEGWDAYLSDGQPDWRRIAVSGFSQGAGMAAYIAKTREVARVILFSGPQDVAGPQRAPAPWLSAPGATPPDRWFAAYSSRERAMATLKKTYAALGMPEDHIEIFDLDLDLDRPEPSGARKPSNPYHSATIRDKRYAPKWRALFGEASPRSET
jgi:dienelactone hydrolase